MCNKYDKLATYNSIYHCLPIYTFDLRDNLRNFAINICHFKVICTFLILLAVYDNCSFFAKTKLNSR